ncbi:MAG: hypothetical protein ACW96M_02420 [Candidatus Thorarchaeota archaeon]|jgi:hypothetical protein
MNEERDYIICTSKDESVCVACEIEGELNCRYDEELVKCFRNRHYPFRALQLVVVAVTSLLIGLLFAVVLILNFTVIETRYLCRHCPFYEIEGKTLHCITLKGMPRIWEFDPTPIGRGEKIGMAAVGGFIDLFPIAVAAYATWLQFTLGADLLSTAMYASLTLIALIAAGYLGKFLGDNYCNKCVNLSCMMNKVPEELKEEYLRKNPEWLKIWESYGHVLGDKLIRENHSA